MDPAKTYGFQTSQFLPSGIDKGDQLKEKPKRKSAKDNLNNTNKKAATVFAKTSMQTGSQTTSPMPEVSLSQKSSYASPLPVVLQTNSAATLTTPPLNVSILPIAFPNVTSIEEKHIVKLKDPVVSKDPKVIDIEVRVRLAFTKFRTEICQFLLANHQVHEMVQKEIAAIKERLKLERQEVKNSPEYRNFYKDRQERYDIYLLEDKIKFNDYQRQFNHSAAIILIEQFDLEGNSQLKNIDTNPLLQEALKLPGLDPETYVELSSDKLPPSPELFKILKKFADLITECAPKFRKAETLHSLYKKIVNCDFNLCVKFVQNIAESSGKGEEAVAFLNKEIEALMKNVLAIVMLFMESAAQYKATFDKALPWNEQPYKIDMLLPSLQIKNKLEALLYLNFGELRLKIAKIFYINQPIMQRVIIEGANLRKQFSEMRDKIKNMKEYQSKGAAASSGISLTPEQIEENKKYLPRIFLETQYNWVEISKGCFNDLKERFQKENHGVVGNLCSEAIEFAENNFKKIIAGLIFENVLKNLKDLDKELISKFYPELEKTSKMPNPNFSSLQDNLLEHMQRFTLHAQRLVNKEENKGPPGT